MAANKEGKCFIFKAAGYSSKDALELDIAEFKGSKMVKNLVNCSPASDPSNKNDLRKSLESISASSLTLYFTGYGGCEVLGSDNEGKVYLCLSEDEEVVYIEEIVNWLAPSCKTGRLFFELYLPKGSQTLSTLVLPACKDFTIAISGLAEKKTRCAFWTKELVAAYEEGSSLSSILTNVNYLYTEKSGLSGIPMFTSSIKKSKPADSAPRSTHVQATSSANTSSTQSSSSSSSVSSTPVSTGNTSSVKTTTSQHDSSKTGASSSPDILSKVPEEKELASVLTTVLTGGNRDTWLKFAKQLLGEIGFKYERLSMQPSVAIFINTVYKNKYRPTWGQVINALDKPRIVEVKGVKASDKLKKHLNI